MLKVSDFLDASKVGPCILNDSMPVYNYVNGVKTNEVIGTKYIVLLPKHKYNKLYVRVDGPKQLGDFDDSPNVTFDNLKLNAYADDKGFVHISASAEGIKVSTGK